MCFRFIDVSTPYGIGWITLYQTGYVFGVFIRLVADTRGCSIACLAHNSLSMTPWPYTCRGQADLRPHPGCWRRQQQLVQRFQVGRVNGRDKRATVLLLDASLESEFMSRCITITYASSPRRYSPESALVMDGTRMHECASTHTSEQCVGLQIQIYFR